MVELPVVRNTTLAAPVISAQAPAGSVARPRQAARVRRRRPPGSGGAVRSAGTGRVQPADDRPGAERADQPAVGGVGATESVAGQQREADLEFEGEGPDHGHHQQRPGNIRDAGRVLQPGAQLPGGAPDRRTGCS